MTDKPTYEELEQRVQELEQAESERKRVEEALSESERKFRNILVQTPQIGIALDPEAQIVFTNARFLELTGWTEEEVIGGNWFDLFIPEDIREEVREVFSLAMDSDSTHGFSSYENEILTRTGERRIVAWSNVITKDAEGAIVDVTCLGVDLTERKQAEEALQEREAFTKTVMDHLPIGVAVNSVDPTVEFSYMNDNFPKIYRTTREALAEPDTFWDVVYEDPVFREKIKNRVAEDVASGDPDRMYWEDVPFTRKGEGPFYICARNIPLKGKEVNISTVWDVTDRKLAEEALRESRDLLDAAQRLAKVGGWVWDVARRAMTWTDQAYRIHGFEPGEVAAGSPEHVERSLACYDPDDRPVIEAAFLRCAEEGIPYDLEFPFTTADGHRKWVQTTAQPVFDGQRVVRVIGNIVDITERKKAEETLRESESRFHRMLGVVPDMISIHSPEMDILYSNWQGFAAVPETKQIPNTKCYKTYRGFDKICPDCQAGSVLESRKPLHSSVMRS